MIGMAEYEDNHFDLAIVDPPYGLGASEANFMRQGKQTGKSLAISGLNYKAKDWDGNVPDWFYFWQLSRISKNQIIWGVNNYPFYFGKGRVVWDKDNSDNKYSDCELAYQSLTDGVRKFRWRWHGMLQERMDNKEERIHPTQKPIALYKWLLTKYAKQGDLILDTHVGSASSLIACEDMGFSYTGFELDEDYYNSAQKRLTQFRSQLKLAI